MASLGHETTQTATFTIPGMGSDHCAGIVRTSLTRLRPATPALGSAISYTIMPFLLPRMISSMHKRFFHPQEMPERVRQALPVEMLYRPEAIKMNSEDQLSIVPSLIDLQVHYERYPLPVAIFAGTEDKTTDPQKHAVPLYRKLPSATLHLLLGLGHMIHHFAQEEIAKAVEDLFAGRPARPEIGAISKRRG